jgi:hypothetical protein
LKQFGKVAGCAEKPGVSGNAAKQCRRLVVHVAA